MEKFGSVRIELNALIQKSGISKNKLCQRAELQRTQLNNYCNNQISRLDIDVLAPIDVVHDPEYGYPENFYYNTKQGKPQD